MNKRLKTNIAFVAALLGIVFVPYGIGRGLYGVVIPTRYFRWDASIYEFNVGLWGVGLAIVFLLAINLWAWRTILRMFYIFIDKRINRQ